MLYDISLTREQELIGDAHRIALKAQLDEARKLERLQRSVRVMRARLGLAPASAI